MVLARRANIVKLLNGLVKHHAPKNKPCNIIQADFFIAVEPVPDCLGVQHSVDLFHVGKASDASPPTGKEQQTLQRCVDLDRILVRQLTIDDLVGLRIGFKYEDIYIKK